MTTRGRPAGRRAEETRDRLLDAAALLFRERGYDATSLKDVAKEVDVTASALYWHFSSKSDLLLSVADRTLTRFQAGVTAAVESTDGSPTERLRATVRYWVRAQLQDSADVVTYSYLYAMGQLIDYLPEQGRLELVAREGDIIDLLRSSIVDGVSAGTFTTRHPSTVAYAIAGMCEMVQTWFRDDGLASREEVEDRYADLALSMVGAR